MDRGRSRKFHLSLCLVVACVAVRGEVPAPTPVAAASITSITPVIVYHHVKWLKPTDDAIERGLTILPPQFQMQLEEIARRRYRVITAAALIQALHSGQAVRSHSMVLTFDDGYSDVYTNVYPELRRSHLRATFFVVPGFIGTPRYMTWAQVRNMASHGMDIEAHTMTHPDLTTLPPAKLAKEVAGSRSVLERMLHRPVRVFAYPYGAYNSSVEEAVHRAGFWGAFTTQIGIEESSGMLLQLPRIYAVHGDRLPV